MPTPLKLPASLTDPVAMKRLRARLLKGELTLDWSGVSAATAEALASLLHDLDIAADADRLGIDTVPDALADAVMVATRPLVEVAAPARKKTESSETAPAVWTAGLQPKLAKESKKPVRPTRKPSGERPATRPSERPTGPAPSSSVEVRDALVRALAADLVGPMKPSDGGAFDDEEILRIAPSRFYHTGFLVPVELPGQGALEDPTEDDDELNEANDGDAEDAAPVEPGPKRKQRLPASIGLSVLLPPGSETARVTVRYADYVLDELPRSGDAKLSSARADYPWRRVSRTPPAQAIALDRTSLTRGTEVTGSGGLFLEGHIEPARAGGLPEGTRALSLFLVNRRQPGEPGKRDAQMAFQVVLTVESADGLVRRPNLRDERSADDDERTLDLQFRDESEWAVGHGVAVEPVWDEGSGPHLRHAVAMGARTTWLPLATVLRVETRSIEGVNLDMDELAVLPSPEAVRGALGRIPVAYRAWIADQRHHKVGTTSRTRRRDELLADAEHAARRIEEGIALLASDQMAFQAFRWMNRAMATQARRRRPDDYPEGGARPRWRLFQLAFVLLSLNGVANPKHHDREVVDLIFFPTGGGKTEAYLGLIAMVLLLRRLSGMARPDQGLGVAVLLRYTLRLLTLDQLDRAATLLCALEMLRRERPEELGELRFAVGLWVGRSATANTFEEVRKAIVEYKAHRAQSPFPLTKCPWCGSELTSDSLTLVPTEAPCEVVAACPSFRCEFSARKNREGLPVLFVDEQIYRELPAFLVATVDKLALLPWRGETGKLFGRIHSRVGRRFLGPIDGALRSGPQTTLIPAGLQPPELVVQDELHLIAGPLGSMVGLYETAIDALSTQSGGLGQVSIRPKIIASTATVRRAREQVRALFDRIHLRVFPPPGVTDAETFFGRKDLESPGRLYLGVAAPGRTFKATLLRTYTALLAAASRQWQLGAGKVGKDHPADPYMTLVGYFNSLRELGGMRRLVEDDVAKRLEKIEGRGAENARGPNLWFANRTIQAEPVELTSRESTSKVASSKARLEVPHDGASHVDVLLASNMISVGVDIPRLGLMVVAGQPKTTSEYIQATSRVGRDKQRPGLVVTVHDCNRPRDRSHFERFGAYHACFYRFVEATSVTPFSLPALDRGLAAVLVALVRLGDPNLTPPEGMMDLPKQRPHAEGSARLVAARAGSARDMSEPDRKRVVAAIEARANNLVDAWERVVERANKDAGKRSYSPFDRPRLGNPLLHQSVDVDKPVVGTDDAKFAAPTSMRDVEPTVHLWLERDAGRGERSRG